LRTPANILLSVSLALVAAAVPSAAHAADLNLAPDWKVVAVDMAVFGLLIYPVNRLLIAPMLRLVAERQRATTGSLDRAGQLQKEASELGHQLEARLAEARARANAQRVQILGAAEEEERALMNAASADAARTIQVARGAIEADLVEVRSALERDAGTLAREAASRLLGRAI
jgi:F-type H+-transporting ATPase subunit b